ncbi:MAG: DUF4382 domain-containing protein [Ferruginibacter sp.]
MKKILSIAISMFVIVVLLTSCSKDSQEGTSMLNVRLTDAPTAFDEVNIDIQEVKIKFTDDDSTDNNWITLITHPGIYNLLAYQNGVDTLLATGVFSTRVVKEIRFILGPNNNIVNAGIIYPLTIPSGSESGLKLKINKELHASLETIIIDFDAALSIHQNGTGDYLLKPVLRIK